MTRGSVECPTVAHCVKLEHGQSERYTWHGVWAVIKKPTRLWLRCVWMLIEFVNSPWLHVVISGSAKVPSGFVEQNWMLLQPGPLHFDTGLFPQLMVNLSPFLNKPPLTWQGRFSRYLALSSSDPDVQEEEHNGWPRTSLLYLFSFCILCTASPRGWGQMYSLTNSLKGTWKLSFG